MRGLYSEWDSWRIVMSVSEDSIAELDNRTSPSARSSRLEPERTRVVDPETVAFEEVPIEDSKIIFASLLIGWSTTNGTYTSCAVDCRGCVKMGVLLVANDSTEDKFSFRCCDSSRPVSIWGNTRALLTSARVRRTGRSCLLTAWD